MPTMTDHRDIDRDDVQDMDLDGERLEPNPDVRVSLTIPLTEQQLDALEQISRERGGISIVATVQRLVEEGLERRASRPAPLARP